MIIVNKFRNVFPNDLFTLSLNREIKFVLDFNFGIEPNVPNRIKGIKI